jgi:predicted protein tyrosine phosphatase
MQNEKIKKLIEDLDSVGFKIEKIDCASYFTTKIVASPIDKIKKTFSKERMIKLIEVLSSFEYNIEEYEFLCERFCRVKFVLRNPERNNNLS